MIPINNTQHFQGESNFYLTSQGKKVSQTNYDYDRQSNINICPRILGGKGGFGSMLRAIGAQIEKTTNREACRDLSGRRLRDINEEKRMKGIITFIENIITKAPVLVFIVELS